GLRFDVRNKLCVSSFESTACKGDSGSPLVVKNLQVGKKNARIFILKGEDFQ
ncbi:hypothetical protein ILUMI_17270, partial [Ignelater luminosus]